MKFANKITFFFIYIMFLIYFLSSRILSYFAKPNFIIYDEWFDDNLEKNNFYLKNKK